MHHIIPVKFLFSYYAFVSLLWTTHLILFCFLIDNRLYNGSCFILIIFWIYQQISPNICTANNICLFLSSPLLCHYQVSTMSYMLKTSESKPLVQITLPHHSFEHQHFSPLIFLSLSMNLCLKFLIFSLVQSLSHVQLFVSPWTAACQASLSITNSRVYPNSCSLSWWCQITISSSVIPFSSHVQSFQSSESFKWVSSSHQVAKVLEFQLQHQSFQWTRRTDLL